MSNLVSNLDYTLLNADCSNVWPTSSTATTTGTLCQTVEAGDVPTDPSDADRLTLVNTGLGKRGTGVIQYTDVADFAGLSPFEGPLGLGGALDPYDPGTITGEDWALWIYLTYQAFWWYVVENDITVYAVGSPYLVSSKSDASGTILFPDTDQFDYTDYNELISDLTSSNGKVGSIANPHYKLALDYATSAPPETLPDGTPRAISPQNEPWENGRTFEESFRSGELCGEIGIIFFDRVYTTIEEEQTKRVGLLSDTA